VRRTYAGSDGRYATAPRARALVDTRRMAQAVCAAGYETFIVERGDRLQLQRLRSDGTTVIEAAVAADSTLVAHVLRSWLLTYAIEQVRATQLPELESAAAELGIACQNELGA